MLHNIGLGDLSFALPLFELQNMISQVAYLRLLMFLRCRGIPFPPGSGSKILDIGATSDDDEEM